MKYFWLLIYFLAGKVFLDCPYGQIESAKDCNLADDKCNACVPIVSFLLGGRNLLVWAKDAEIWDDGGKLDIDIAEYPFSLDSPYIWWSRAIKSVVVCGGKNWDEDVSDSRCFSYDHCNNTWNHMLDLPIGIHGGTSGYGYVDGNEELWVVGGGNGTATSHNFILKYNGGNWTVERGIGILGPRFGHCGVSINNKIVIIGGKQGEDVLDSMEIIDIANRTTHSSQDWKTSHQRWGALCLPDSKGNVLVMGGLDPLFLPHSNVDILNLGSMTWSKGPSLPWPQSGAVGMVTARGATLFSGYSGIGLEKHVASLEQGNWLNWDQKLNLARISGAAVAIPSDAYDIC